MSVTVVVRLRAVTIRFRDVPEPPETWLEVDLRNGWIAAYRLLRQRDAIVFGELRVFPRETGRRYAGRWSAEELGDDATAPPGGLSTETLRAVKLGEHRHQAERELARFAGRIRRRWPDYDPFGPDGVLGRHGITREAVTPSGRRTRDERFYAGIAALYAEQVAAGSRRPVKAVAEAIGADPGYTRNLVEDCRKLGLLTAAKHGRAGGKLTAKARRLLRGARRGEEQR